MKRKAENEPRQKTEQERKTGMYTVIQAAIDVLIVFIHILLMKLYPAHAHLFEKTATALLLCGASVYDIRTAGIPITTIAGMISINIIYPLVCSWEANVLFISGLPVLVLFIIYFINRNVIGPGDILLLGAAMPALTPVEIFGFLFLCFSFSSVVGIIMGIKRKKIKGTIIPLAPCIALAFFIRALIL